MKISETKQNILENHIQEFNEQKFPELTDMNCYT